MELCETVICVVFRFFDLFLISSKNLWHMIFLQNLVVLLLLLGRNESGKKFKKLQDVKKCVQFWGNTLYNWKKYNFNFDK